VPNGVTVTGPPRTLEMFQESAALENVRTKSIPIRVPAHASHLFAAEDVNSILNTTFVNPWSSYTSKVPVISSATGKLAWAGNFRSLLQAALTDILTEPLRWDNINEELPLLLRSSGVSRVKLTPIGSTAENMVQHALKDALGKSPDSTKYSTKSQHSDAVPELTIEIDYQETEQSLGLDAVPLGKSKLAIVGMSGRFPDAETPEEFWDLLYRGLDVVKEVPPRRWDTKTHVDPTGKTTNTGATPWGCWLENPAVFDARFFSISPKEAPQIDPAQRLALMSTYEAMEAAGLVPGTTPSTQTDRIGVFHGITSNDYMETNTSQDIDTYFIPGGNRAFVAGRLNFCFQFAGPSYTNDTACSSSLAAIHLACNSLWRHDVDTAVAGGTNMINNPDG
jgi:noranthrone synthase